MMIKLLGVIMLANCLPPNTRILHSNILGELRIDNFNHELFVDAYLDKQMLTTALIREADCQPQDMMSVCGGQYLQDHVKIHVNGQLLSFSQQAMEVHKEYVVYRYYLGETDQSIQTIKVESDYLLDYYEHTVLKVKIGVEDLTKSYNLNATMKKIEAKIS